MYNNPRVAEIDRVAHELNSIYLRNMSGSLYIRLAAAHAVGLPLETYEAGFRRVNEHCSSPDRSGQNFSEAAAALVQVVDEVRADFANFKLQPSSPQIYMRRLIVAALEARRLRTLLLAFENQTPADPVAAKRQNEVAQAYIRRLLRLQYHYPALVLSGVLGGGVEFEAAVDRFMNTNRGWGLQPLLQSDPQVEAYLGLTPAGTAPAQLPPPPWATNSNILREDEVAYRDLYTSILEGRRPIHKELSRRIRNALDMSVRETLSSAHLKCQNTSPCAALSIEPNLAASLISTSPNADQIRRQACQCKIGAQHEWVDGRLNLALGFVTAGAVVGAALTPAGWFTYLAYGLATADSLAAGAGINDSYINVRRSEGVALLRSGGAVNPIVELDTISEHRTQAVNAAYNLVTGLIGMTPPGRILGRSVGISALDKLRSPETIAQAKLEFSKAFSGSPAPDLSGDGYESNYDPRETTSPIPFELRSAYPRLAENFDRAYGRLNRLDPEVKLRMFNQLKAAARTMAASNDPAAQELLSKGVIPRRYLPTTATAMN